MACGVRVQDAVVCRGVLNDLIENDERVEAMNSFASMVFLTGS